MDTLVKCPVYNSTHVVDDDCTDIVNLGEVAVLTYHGGCEWCGASLTWDEVFEFKKIDNVIVHK